MKDESELLKERMPVAQMPSLFSRWRNKKTERRRLDRGALDIAIAIIVVFISAILFMDYFAILFSS